MPTPTPPAPVKGNPIEDFFSGLGSGIKNAISGIVPSKQYNVTPVTASAKSNTPAPAPVSDPAVGAAAASNLAAHISSTSPGAKSPALTGGSSSTSGLTSTADQKKTFDAINSSDTDLSSGGSALAAFNAASGSATDPVTAQIEANLQSLMNQVNTPPPSLLAQYNQLLSSSGIQADQLSELNLETIMSGTVNDIRNELTAHGGFADESQIQALASTRNQALQSQLTALQQADSLKQSWIDSTMKYTQDDYTNTENNFEKNYQLQNTLLSTLQRVQNANATADYRFQNQQMSSLKFLLDSGGLANASDSLIASYSATTGIPADAIKQAATSEDAKIKLTQALQASLLNERQNGGAGSTADVARATRVQGYLTQNQASDGTVTPATYAQAFQQYISMGGTAENFINEYPSSQYIPGDAVFQLPSSVPEFATMQFNQNFQDAITSVNAGSIDAGTAENRLLAAYPDQATKIKDYFSNVQ